MKKTDALDLTAAEKIAAAIELHLKDDKWKYDEENFGIMTGLLCAFELITGERVEHFKKPTTWLRDTEEQDETSHAPFDLKEKKLMDV